LGFFSSFDSNILNWKLAHQSLLLWRTIFSCSLLYIRVRSSYGAGKKADSGRFLNKNIHNCYLVKLAGVKRPFFL